MSVSNELRLMVGTSRIGPIRYFSYLGVAYVIMLILMALAGLILGLMYSGQEERAVELASYFHTLILQPLYLLVNLWWLSRRLHDFNVSGWWVLVPLISLFGLMGIMLFSIPIPQMLGIALLFLGIGSLLILTILGIFPGRPGRDDYGPPPPKNTIFNYIFFVVFVVSFFGYLIWRLMVLFAVRG